VDPVAGFQETSQDCEIWPLVVDDEDAAAARLADAVKRDQISQAVIEHWAESMGH
jgi:hypothetical protein